MKLSLLIPVYNERLYLAEVLKRVVLCPLPQCGSIKEIEVVLVDDFSTDGSREWVEARLAAYESLRADGVQVRTKYFFQDRNIGKGAAIRRAMRESTGDIVLLQDADLEYSPTDYPKLIQPIIDGVADAVFGSRFQGEIRRVHFFWHSVGNKILTTLSNMATDLMLTDMETCYKAISGPVARSLRLTSNRFGIEPEITARLARLRSRVYEVPISYYGRSYEEGKKIGWKDGAAALWHILKYNYFDREPIHAGMSQTLLALSDESAKFYYPQLKRAIEAVQLDKRRDLQILEVGSGIGTITQYLLRQGDVMATDISEEYVDHLRRRFGFCESFRAKEWDAGTPPPEEIASRGYDLIVAFNVLEHIGDDEKTLNNWRSLLNPNGVLVVLVPWAQYLYCGLDEAVGHYRRYSPSLLTSTLEKSGFQPIALFRDNPLGILGWFLNGKILRRRALPSGQVSFYGKIKPLVWPIEAILRKFVGLNLVVVAKQR